MSEPRSEQQIRSDLVKIDRTDLTLAEKLDAFLRLAVDVAPLLDALSAALAAKAEVEQQNERLRKQLDEAARYGLDSGL